MSDKPNKQDVQRFYNALRGQNLTPEDKGIEGGRNFITRQIVKADALANNKEHLIREVTEHELEL
jgi:hypothetical protein